MRRLKISGFRDARGLDIRGPGKVIAGASAMSVTWRDPGTAALALSTNAASWRNPGPVVLDLPMQATAVEIGWRDPGKPAVLCRSRSANPGTSEGADRKKPRYDWQCPTMAILSADGVAQSGAHRASWQDPSGSLALCSDSGLTAGELVAKGGGDSRAGASQRRPVINLDASAIQLAAGGHGVPRDSEYARNGVSLQRIRGVMNSPCACSKNCNRQLSIQRVARVCNLFWSLTSLEQEHLVRPHVASSIRG